MTNDQFNQLLSELKACRQDIESLKKRIDDLHDPVLQALLEEYIKIKVPPSSPIQDLINKANKKSS